MSNFNVFVTFLRCLMVASGSDVKVYNIQSGICLHTLRHHKKRIVSLHENKNNSVQVCYKILIKFLKFFKLQKRLHSAFQYSIMSNLRY